MLFWRKDLSLAQDTLTGPKNLLVLPSPALELQVNAAIFSFFLGGGRGANSDFHACPTSLLSYLSSPHLSVILRYKLLSKARCAADAVGSPSFPRICVGISLT